MSDLDALERLPAVIEPLARRAGTHGPLQLASEPILVGLARYRRLREEHPELSDEARFTSVFGEDPAARAAMTAMATRLTALLEHPQWAGLATGTVQREDVLLLVVELAVLFHSTQIPEAEAARTIMAFVTGEKTFPETIAALPAPPKPLAKVPRDDTAPLPRRSLSGMFALFERRAIVFGDLLRVTPLLAAAKRCAAGEDPEITDVQVQTPEGDVHVAPFEAWYAQACEVIDNLDEPLRLDFGLLLDQMLLADAEPVFDAHLFLLEMLLQPREAEQLEGPFEDILAGRLPLDVVLRATVPVSGPSLARLEHLPSAFRSLANLASSVDAPLLSAPLLAGVASYMDARDARPDVDAETRFREVFGDAAGLRTELPTWVGRIGDLLDLDPNPLRQLCERVDRPDFEARYVTVLLFAIELLTRELPFEDQGPTLGELARGDLSLVDALARLPEPTRADGPSRLPRRPLPEVFAELEQHALATKVSLTVLPLLAAARRYAETTEATLGATDVKSLAPDAEVPEMPFSDWFEQATALVADDVRFEIPLPSQASAMRGRQLDILLYLLEATTGPLDLDDDATDDNVEALLTGRMTLADALKR